MHLLLYNLCSIDPLYEDIAERFPEFLYLINPTPPSLPPNLTPDDPLNLSLTPSEVTNHEHSSLLAEKQNSIHSALPPYVAKYHSKITLTFIPACNNKHISIS